MISKYCRSVLKWLHLLTLPAEGGDAPLSPQAGQNLVFSPFLVFTIWVGVALSHRALICLSLMINVVGLHYVCSLVCFGYSLFWSEFNNLCVCVSWGSLSLLLISGNSLHILDIDARNLWTFLFCILQLPLLTVSSDKKSTCLCFWSPSYPLFFPFIVSDFCTCNSGIWPYQRKKNNFLFFFLRLDLVYSFRTVNSLEQTILHGVRWRSESLFQEGHLIVPTHCRTKVQGLDTFFFAAATASGTPTL